MEVVDCMHAEQNKGVSHISGDAGAFPECEVRILMTRSCRHPRALLWVLSCKQVNN